jgi:hypothetical protein
VANNRIALINTIEKPIQPVERSGEMVMGGKNWYWKESIKKSTNDDYFEYEILVRSNDQENFIYAIKGFLNNA